MAVWSAEAAFRSGLDFFDEAVGLVAGGEWQSVSPCAGWSALDVLGHMGVGTDFGTRLLRGESPDWDPVDPPGAAVTGDPAQWWARISAAAREAVQDVDLTREIDSPRGRRSVADGLRFPAVDLFVHAWDLARSVGQTVDLPEGAIAFAYDALAHVPVEQLRSARVFGAESGAPPGSSATERFIAWTGRDPN